LLARLAESDPDELVRATAQASLDGDTGMRTLRTLSLMERILFLRRVPLFLELTPSDLKQIAGIAGEHWFAGGEVISEQGEMGEEMFIIVSGEVRVVTRGEDGTEVEIARRRPGEYVGEMSIISQEPRMASLTASGEVRALCIEQAEFEELLRLRPETSLAVMRVLCQRLREREQGEA
jgi:CRP/FNR family transcriptional regulator